jgi:hypothetical protein
MSGIKPQSRKQKGRALQQYVRDRLLARFPWLGEGDVESCSMGAGGVDIKMSPLARRTLPISIECKKTKKTPSRSELEQSEENAYSTTLPAVVWCPHGKGPDKSMIMFDLEDFLAWYEQIAEVRLEQIRKQAVQQ